MPGISPLEIQALTKIMEELDYYQILHLEPSATTSEIKKAFHQTSRTFHPDANRGLDEKLRGDCERIAKRVTEAYCVLRDPRRRRAYDDHLAGGGGLRMQLAEARSADAKQQSAERGAITPQGKQFWQKASDDRNRGDLAGAARNLQMAITFESDNAFLKEQLAEIKAELKARK